MRRILLSPVWWAGHVGVVLLVLLFVRLGWWQFDRSTSPTGSIQNFGYALQWPIFAGVLVYGWCRMVRDEAKGISRQQAATGSDARVRAGATPFGGDAKARVAARERAEAAAAQDEELSAYNRYLAELAARDRPRR